MIDGNLIGTFQTQTTKKNSIGEGVLEWSDVIQKKGFLDYVNGEADYEMNAKIQESTHIFLCDFQSFTGLSGQWIWDTMCFVNGKITTARSEREIDVTSENARLLIDGQIYEIKLIDDPMHLHQHLEIYLKYVGGQSTTQ